MSFPTPYLIVCNCLKGRDQNVWHVPLRGILCIKKPQTTLFQLLNRELTKFLASTLALKSKKKKKNRGKKKRQKGKARKRKGKESKQELWHGRDWGIVGKDRSGGRKFLTREVYVKDQKINVFHDVTPSMSVSGKVLEKADIDLFNFSNANYSCHVFKPCSRSKEYCVQGKKKKIIIYLLPTNWFDQADTLGIVISSLLFRILWVFFAISSWFTVCSLPPPCFLLFSSFIFHSLKEVDAKFFLLSLCVCFYFPVLSIYWQKD